jgi:uncharacterized protein YndB with AHSA1/START domain
MEGVLAILGFWIFMIAIVVKKPLMAYLEKSKEASKDLNSPLADRVNQLESAVVTMGKDIQEVKDTSEFAHKLLIDSAHQIADAHKLLTHNAQQMADAHVLVTSVQNEIAKGMVTIAAPPYQSQKLLTTSVPLINELGKVTGDGTIRFERVLPVPVERVWQYLTASDCLPQWLAAGNIEQQFGGKVELNFNLEEMSERKEKGARIHGRVNFIEPLRAIAYSWIDDDSNLNSNVSFQLSAQGDETSLVLTHSQVPGDRMADVMAGWHTHLDILKARLTDAVAPVFGKRFKEVLQTYAAVVATSAVIVSTAVTPSAAIAAPNNQAYQQIKAEQSHLLSKYDALARDADDLKKQIADLKRDSSDEAVRAADKLQGQLDDDNRDLNKLDLEIKDLDKALD